MELVKCRPYAVILFGMGNRAGICFRKPGVSAQGTSRRKRIFHTPSRGDLRKHGQRAEKDFRFPIAYRQMELEENKPLNGIEEEKAKGRQKETPTPETVGTS